ncbi:hypothetical protein K814_0131305 [Pseudomonas fluorescens LMG 5329]|uniref:Uncharacterized protein n=1 Tax=Pseudomonas fluorescens LMG 5329 TaxID=1324332 RepID=A0A0A1YUE6_PSEFL|nr:hypothetical protein K814_0131305 [Pseudomonas fluorescens LMG 5329]
MWIVTIGVTFTDQVVPAVDEHFAFLVLSYLTSCVSSFLLSPMVGGIFSIALTPNRPAFITFDDVLIFTCHGTPLLVGCLPSKR